MPEFTGDWFYPILFRALQTALEAAPTFLCGLVLAGLLRGIVGPAVLRDWFTNDARLGPFRACLIGLALPVCSFGVLPVAWELRRAGIARATVLTFLVSAPLANPISLAFAYPKLESQGTFAVSAFMGLLLGALLLLAGLGVLLGRWLPEAAAAPPDLPPLPVSPLLRLWVVALCSARGLTGILPLFLLVGLLGSGALALVPGGALEQAAKDRTLEAPLHLALAALPAQIPPEQGAMLLCDMLFMGVSLGSALVFLLLGIGLNLGTIAWIGWAYGLRVVVVMLPILLGTAVAVGFALPISLPYVAPDAAQRRHFLEIETTSGVEIAWARAVKDTVLDDTPSQESLRLGMGACVVLGLLAVLGMVARTLGERATIHRQMPRSSEQSSEGQSSPWNRQLGAAQLALLGLAIALLAGVALLYVAYPSPGVVLEEMNTVQIDFSLTLKTRPLAREDALRLVARWQRLQSKIRLGDFLRRGRFDSPLRQPSEDLRLAIEKLRIALVEAKPSEELNALYAEARKSAQRCRQVLELGRQP